MVGDHVSVELDVIAGGMYRHVVDCEFNAVQFAGPVAFEVLDGIQYNLIEDLRSGTA